MRSAFVAILRTLIAGNSSTRIDGPAPCDVDICLATLTEAHHRSANAETLIIVSASLPNGNVRALDHDGVIVWQIDAKSHPELKPGFDPCAVASAPSGQIYVADKGTNTVQSFVCC